MTEILVAVGIMSIIAGIGTFSYLKYYENAKLFKIQQTAENFHKAVKICLIKHHDDPEKCASFRRLKFNCEYCKPEVCWIEHNSYSTPPHRPAMNFGIRMTVGNYRSTVQYSLSFLPMGSFRIQEVGGTSLKFCSKVRTYLDGVPLPISPAPIKKPIRRCQADSDCDTGNGEYCWGPLLPNWVNCGGMNVGTP